MADEELDYYQVLQVERTATQEEIKKSYRRLAMKYHPDRNHGDKAAEEKFKQVGEAYQVLGDEQKRAAYDRYGHSAFQAGGAGGNPFGNGFPGGFQSANFEDISDIFSEIFGGGRSARGDGNRQYVRGADLQYDLTITLEQAAHGCKMNIRVPVWEECQTCHGSGCKPGTHKTTCKYCGGTGFVRSGNGFFSVQQTCPKCQGTGEVIENPCPTCHGTGSIKKTKDIEVSVPAGIDDGQRVRLSGKGEPGIGGGHPGDLYVRIHIQPHDLFVRDGTDLHVELPIGFATAALGGELEVPTLDTKTTIKIPEGTQNGKTFRLREYGMPAIRSDRKGDLYVHIIVETPVNLTKEQKELLAKFDESLNKGGKKHHSVESQGILDKLKKFFQ